MYIRLSISSEIDLGKQRDAVVGITVDADTVGVMSI